MTWYECILKMYLPIYDYSFHTFVRSLHTMNLNLYFMLDLSSTGCSIIHTIHPFALNPYMKKEKKQKQNGRLKCSQQ